jgi:phosphatidylglycerophosphatase A
MKARRKTLREIPMRTTTDPASSATAPSATAATGSAATPLRQPRFALFVATAGGIGYLPKAPGTWGSLAGLLLPLLPGIFFHLMNAAGRPGLAFGCGLANDPFLFFNLSSLVVAAAVGTWASDRTARFWDTKDPRKVVIDEVSGQHLAILMGCGLPLLTRNPDALWRGFPLGMVSIQGPVGWKYLLLGFILFRAFDIWKPFPARQAEGLPGGWGIMADDWVAGGYAALGLWIARMLGL